MAYRNKTYVAFASEDIRYYRIMEAWRDNDKIDFNFFDAHDINTARDSSLDETIRRRLRERMVNAKQAVLLASPDARRKGGDISTFLGYEVAYLLTLGIPIVVAHLDGSKTVNTANIPKPIQDSTLYTVSVAFRMKIIKYALDNYVAGFGTNKDKAGCMWSYPAGVYDRLGL